MIITIGRQHGSNGHLIAGGLAERLGYRCLDKEIVDRAAEDSNFNKAILASYDEKRISPYFSGSLQYMGGMGEGFRLSTQIAAAQFDAIRSLANEGNCIFVGRCADYVLRDMPNVVKVFITASMRSRIDKLLAQRSMTPQQAKRYILQAEEKRASYYNYYTGKTWGAAESYDLCIDSSILGLEETEKLIADFIRKQLDV